MCKNKLRRDYTLENLDMYEFKIALFGNGEPDEFLLLVRNFNMMIDSSGILAANTRFQYLRTLLRGDVLNSHLVSRKWCSFLEILKY